MKASPSRPPTAKLTRKSIMLLRRSVLSEEVHPKTSPEAKEVIWVPISFLSDSRNTSSMTFTIDDRSVTMGCYTHSGHVIWGRSFRIVRDIIELLTRDTQDI
jgi:hypothetical protein